MSTVTQASHETQASHASQSQSSLVSATCCRSCGVDVPAAMRQVETARQRLLLLQEKLQLDEQLLKAEKRNWKRRSRAMRSSLIQQQQRLQKREEQLQSQQERKDGEVVERLNERIAALEAQLREKERQEQDQKKEAEIAAAAAAAASKKEEEEADGSAEEAEAAAVSTPAENQLRKDDGEEIEQLKIELDEKDTEIERLEMQLLEMERERDDFSGDEFGGDNDNSNDAAASSPPRRNPPPCVKCEELEERIREKERAENQEVANLQRLVEQAHDEIERLRREKEGQVKSSREDDKRQEAGSNMSSEESRQLKAENARLEAQVIQQQQELETVAAVRREADELRKRGAATGATTGAAAISESDDSNNKNRKLVLEYDFKFVSPFDFPISGDSDHNGSGGGEEPSMQAPSGGLYTGYVDAGTSLPDGDGTLRLEDGSVLDGAWKNGKPVVGVLCTVDGDIYRGRWSGDGKMHGDDCLYVYADGHLYRGSFDGGLKHGSKGIMTWPYGAHYRGDFSQDKRTGSGKYRHADGRTYEGHYRDDRPHGYGVLKASNGSVIYDGQWEWGEFVSSSSHTKRK